MRMRRYWEVLEFTVCSVLALAFGERVSNGDLYRHGIRDLVYSRQSSCGIDQISVLRCFLLVILGSLKLLGWERPSSILFNTPMKVGCIPDNPSDVDYA